jgi:shikimate dehydrogenase
VLAAAAESDAEYVDVEWRAERGRLPAIAPERLVLSHHSFDGTPADLPERAAEMRRASPRAAVKIACAIGPLSDLIALRDAAVADTGRHIVIGMGAAGAISRVLPVAFGSEWTYGGAAAPGQLPVDELDRQYRIRSQSAATRVFALTGHPLAHSASPAMHNAAFAALGIDAVYVPIESREARALFEVAEAFGVEGVSVTAPLKPVRAWAEAGVDVDERGRQIGAANTLRRGGGSWTATNFDVEGFLAPLHARGIAIAGRRCVVLGTGGAARAAAWALVHEGARVEVCGRRPEAATALAEELGASAGAWPPAPGWDLLVNATPAGTAPDAHIAPLERDAIDGRVVYDLVYHPRRTQLLRWAEAAGAMTIEGLDMLVAQAALQFTHWVGQAAPLEVMRKAAEQFLEKGVTR